jgi:hypothetical protein
MFAVLLLEIQMSGVVVFSNSYVNKYLEGK